MFRQVATAGVIAAAVGGPYVATETDLGKSLTGAINTSMSSSGELLADGSQAANPHYATEQLWDRKLSARDLENFAHPNPQSLSGGPVADFRDVLRFDITPAWVSQRYSRVTTVLSELRLEGLRVPIVTGTKPDDIAGSITYYFRHDQSLQRVVLHGFTGDPNRLISLMTQHYGMSPQPTLDTGVYTINWNGGPTSVLKVTRAPVMYADATRSQHTVFLELNQPHLEYGLSSEASKIVTADRSTGRW